MNKHAHAKAYDEAKQHIEETKTKKSNNYSFHGCSFERE